MEDKHNWYIFLMLLKNIRNVILMFESHRAYTFYKSLEPTDGLIDLSYLYYTNDCRLNILRILATVSFGLNITNKESTSFEMLRFCLSSILKFKSQARVNWHLIRAGQIYDFTSALAKARD